MKKIHITLSIVLMGFMTLSSCAKQGCTDSSALNYSSEAKKDDGSCVMPLLHEEQFTLSYGPGISYAIYEPSFNYEPGDAIIIEHLSDPTYNYYTALPVVTTNLVVWGEYGYDNGDIWIYTDEVSTGNDYTWTSNVTFGFRALLIKKSGLKAHPGIEKMSIEDAKNLLK